MMQRVLSVVCLFLLLLSGPAAGAAPRQGGEQDLRAGRPVERELRGGEVHSYLVRAEAGQYLRAVVEQKGVDVVVRLYAPSDRALAEIDSPNGTRGPEPVSVIVEEAGLYRLEVRALDEKAAAGRYEIEVKELRDATALDRDRVAWEGALAEAQLLSNQGTAESLRKAVEKYEGVLPLLRAAQERQTEAATLQSAGVVYGRLGEYKKSSEYFDQALPLWHAAGDRKGESEALYEIGIYYWRVGENEKALEYLSQALRLKRTIGDEHGAAITLTGIGWVYERLGRLHDALDNYNQALPPLRAAGDGPMEAAVFNSIGLVYYTLGEPQKASGSFDQALALSRASGNRYNEALALSNIGGLHGQLGDHQKALDYYEKALTLWRAMGERWGESTTLHNIGSAYEKTREYQKALEYYEQALALARTLGDRSGESVTLHNIGAVYKSVGDLQKAFEYYDRALQLLRAVGDRKTEAVTLSHIGSILLSQGKPEEALTYQRQALTLQRAVGDRHNEAVTLYNMAHAERDLGRFDEARSNIEATLDIFEDVRSQLFGEQLRTSVSATSQDYYYFYIDLLMRMHRREPSARYDEDALRASERARARGLLEMLAVSRADIRQGVDAELLQRERTAQRQLGAKAEQLTRLLAGKYAEEEAAAVRKEQEELLDAYREAEEQIRKRSPKYAALTQPRPLSSREIQQELDAGTLLLEYALGEEHSYLWAVTPTSVESFELPGRAEIEAQSRRAYEALTARSRVVRFEKKEARLERSERADADFAPAAEALSRTVLGPLAGALEGKRLLVVSDGALQYVPFAALPEPGATRAGGYRPLILGHEVVSLPSASALSLLRRETVGRRQGDKTVAVLADPVFGEDDPRVRRVPVGGDPVASGANGAAHETREPTGELGRALRDAGESAFRRLPFTRREAEGILALTPRGEGRKSLDFDASRETAVGADLGRYRIVHFATHGLLNSQHPELSGVVLSLVDREGRQRDGFLRAYEIYNLKLGAELVVLSACRTALGKEIKGEGLAGLTRGFMYAGAPRVVASLWAVEDETTAELMRRFYRGILVRKQRPAAALREAQVGIWKERRLPPYYWAGFVLQGEWK